MGEQTYDLALDWPRLVLPERARVRPLAHARSGVAVRSLVKSSEYTSGGAMTTRVSTGRADATPRGCFANKIPRGG